MGEQIFGQHQANEEPENAMRCAIRNNKQRTDQTKGDGRALDIHIFRLTPPVPVARADEQTKDRCNVLQRWKWCVRERHSLAVRGGFGLVGAKDENTCALAHTIIMCNWTTVWESAGRTISLHTACAVSHERRPQNRLKPILMRKNKIKRGRIAIGIKYIFSQMKVLRLWLDSRFHSTIVCGSGVGAEPIR